VTDRKPRTELAIAVRRLGKRYLTAETRRERLARLLRRAPRPAESAFWALKGVDLDVPRGQAIAIIGRNGSGKSTLLQLLAGTVAPTEGEVRIRGRVAALLELGAGFNPEFTGRENVFLNGAVLGLTDSEIERRIDEIEAFADIGTFIDQPVKTYSSGMFVRLAFAVAGCVDADILLVDEALAVGDVFFQQKCFRHIRSLQDSGVTIVYVSHDMNSVQTVCQRAILLEAGHVVFDGEPSEAANRYYGSLGQQIGVVRDSDRDNTVTRRGPPVADLDRSLIRSASILHEQLPRHGVGGLKFAAVRFLESLRIQMIVQATVDVRLPLVGFHLYDRYGQLVFATGTLQLGHDLPPLSPGEELGIEVCVAMDVRPGEYTLSVIAGEPNAGDDPNLALVHDCIENLGPVTVTAPERQLMPFYGVARLSTSIAVDTKPEDAC
jgi:lipopolysaccharide transport system ATP-binding protein